MHKLRNLNLQLAQVPIKNATLRDNIANWFHCNRMRKFMQLFITPCMLFPWQLPYETNVISTCNNALVIELSET